MPAEDDLLVTINGDDMLIDRLDLKAALRDVIEEDFVTAQNVFFENQKFDNVHDSLLYLLAFSDRTINTDEIQHNDDSLEDIIKTILENLKILNKEVEKMSSQSGAVFFIDVEPQDKGYIEQKEYGPCQTELKKVYSTTKDLRFKVAAFSGNNEYMPEITVNGKKVELEEKSKFIFDGSADVTVENESITVKHSGGAEQTIDVNVLEIPEVISAKFTGDAYPINNVTQYTDNMEDNTEYIRQKELKKGDKTELRIISNRKIQAVEVKHSKSYFKHEIFEDLGNQKEVVVKPFCLYEKEKGEWASIEFRVKDVGDQWSAWYKTTDFEDGFKKDVTTVKCNNTHPKITIEKINYPGNQNFIGYKNDDCATLKHNVENYYYIKYSSPNEQIDIQDRVAFFEEEKQLCYSSGEINYSDINFTIDAFRRDNGAHTTKKRIINIDTRDTEVSLDIPEIVEPGEEYEVTLVSNRELNDGPKIITQIGNFETETFELYKDKPYEQIWTNTLNVHEEKKPGEYILELDQDLFAVDVNEVISEDDIDGLDSIVIKE